MIRRSVLGTLVDGATAPLFDDAHRTLAKALDDMALESDAALRDPARVAHRMGALGLYRHVGAGSVEVRALCTIRERLAYVSPLADGVFAVQGLAAHPLCMTRDPKHADVLSAMLDGRRIGGFALTEPEAGSDATSLRTTAKSAPGGWILDGKKTFISNVGIASHFIVFANADAALGKKGISAFLVEAGAPGVTLTKIAMSEDHPLGTIALDSCKVSADALVGAVGDGLRLAFGTLDVFRTSVGAAALGMALCAFDDALEHVTRREQFGKKLADFQLTQAAIADMATELEAARFLVAGAACAKDRASDRATRESVAMAKMHATEVAQRVIDRAVQLHGGLGVVSGTRVEALYRAIRPLRIYEGTTEILKVMIGEGLVKRHIKERAP